MNIGFNRVELHLAPREVIRVYDPTGARVECIRGELWITQDRDFEDHLLSANDALTLDRDGLALIHAQEPSDIVLFEPEPRPRLGARIARALLAALRAVGRWFARTFGPESIERMRDRAWHHGL
jgi:hypothetical protein